MTHKEIDKKSQKNAERKKIKRILLWCFVIIFILLLCLIGIVLWGMALLFDHKPLKTANKTLDCDKLEQISKKLGIIQESDNNKENISGYVTLLMQDVKIVELSGDEVNTLLDASLPASNIYLYHYMPELTIADCQFKNGTFIIDSSFENSFSTPFGRYLNMHIVFTPKVINRHLSLKIESISVGTYRVAGAHIQNLVNEELINFEKSDNGKEILNLITTLYVEKSKITIIFKPKKALLFLGKKGATDFSNP